MAEPIHTITLFNARFVPLREALDQLGGRVEWDNVAKRATVHTNGKTILLTMGDPNVESNGEIVTISQPPLIEKGALLVPEDFFLAVIGQTVPLA